MSVRRVITFTDDNGKAGFQVDGVPPRADGSTTSPGFHSTLVWSTPAQPSVGKGNVDDPTPQVTSFVPAPGGSHLMVVTFPPDSSMMRPDFDPMAFGAEMLQMLPGLAEKMEPDNPGMHTTDSVDYDVVLDGEIVLELDDGQSVTLQQHDIVIQNGTRHAWRNATDKPVTMLFVLIGANRSA